MTHRTQTVRATTNRSQTDKAMTHITHTDKAITDIIQKITYWQSNDLQNKNWHTDKAMTHITQTDKAMTNITHTDKSMTNITQSDPLTKADCIMNVFPSSGSTIKNPHENWYTHKYQYFSHTEYHKNDALGDKTIFLKRYTNIMNKKHFFIQ